MADKPNTLVTPRATVTGWVSILKADTKFDDDGVYKIKVRIPNDANGLEEILEAIEKARNDAKAEFQKNPKNKGKRIKEADLPFYEDDGEVVLNFKSKASYIDKKTQERKSRTVTVFGGNGRLKPGEIPNFGEGSEVRIAFQASGFCNAAVGAGVSLRLESIKLLTVKEFVAGGGADPFGDDEDGYKPDAKAGGDSDPYGDDDGPGYQGGDSSADADEDF